MNYKKLFQVVLTAVLIGFTLVGCGKTETISEVVEVASSPATEIKEEATDMAVPPTETPIPPTETAVPPTDRPEVETISAADASISIRELSFRIVEVAFDDTAVGMAPAGMSPNDQIVWVAFELLSGDPGGFESLQISLTDNDGRSSEAIILASEGMVQMLATVTMVAASGNYMPEKENITWAYVFPKDAVELYLKFPSGEIVDLTPVLP
jgi:hypothetical protein